MKKYIYLQFLLVALSLAALLYVAFQERSYVEVPVRMELNDPETPGGGLSAGTEPRPTPGGTMRALPLEEEDTSELPATPPRPETTYQVIPPDRAAPEGAGTFRPVRPIPAGEDGNEISGEETIYQ